MSDEMDELREELPRDAKEAMLWLEKHFPKRWGGPLYEVETMRKQLDRVERMIAAQRAEGRGSERLDDIATKLKDYQEDLDRLQVKIEEDRERLGL